MMTINDEMLRITVLRDITERKKLEDELLKMQRLESIGVLAGGIAHDFNNNLQSILSCVTLAKTYVNPEDEVYEKLEEAKKVVIQSKSLTQQLLTFSKGGEPVKNTISISKLIKNSVNLALSGSNVRCEFGIPDDLWSVEADKGQLNQVISNLIINADQAMPEGGNIKVWAENINVAEKGLLPVEEGNYVKINIEDQGTGISHENLQKIFDPYFTTKQKGSGLGLATCYSIIKKHDGHIDVESEVGIGTVFHLYLPSSRKEISKEDVSGKVDGKCVEKITPLVGRKILLMEDEAIIRLAVTQHLRNLEYEVETAEEGAKAIELYNKAIESGKSFDAVIMDLTIPGGMGGKETVKRLLEIDPEVRVIVASGYANDHIMANYKRYGFSGVLAKPYEIDELDEALKKVMKSM
jgi:nitrogen-specific signal transduction histidine kinase/ActR/RegA family two-component response regulator